MEFNRSVYHNWSPKKHEKWNEWISQYSDDEIVIEGAKAKATENTLFYSMPFTLLALLCPFFYLSNYIESFTLTFALSIVSMACMFFTIRFIVYVYYKRSGMKNYHTRKNLFRAGINSLSMRFHHKGVAKHKAIKQKQYEESRRSNKKG